MDREALEHVLLRSQELGFLGPGGIGPQVDRSLAFASAVASHPQRALDLGSGGGLPGLVLASLWTGSEWVLLDANRRRTEFLAEAVATLGLARRVTVVCERAEVSGRGPLRASRELVVARSFGAPAVTAECGAPFLTVGGWLIVAEPPGGQPARWPTEGLARLGLALGPATAVPVALQALLLTEPCPDSYPRRVGLPNKRPLF